MTTTITPQIQDRKFWLQFINLYKKLPCLWNAQDANYGNKKFRDSALLNLLKKVQDVWPEADIDFIKQRLSNFRRTFTNEYNKVLESKKSGISNTYVPSLYYYNHLKFLKEDETTQDESTHLETDNLIVDCSKDEMQSLPMESFISYTTEEEEYSNSSGCKSVTHEEFCVVTASECEYPKSQKRKRLLEDVLETADGSQKRLLQEVLDTVDNSDIQIEESCEITNNVVVIESSENPKLSEYFPQVEIISEARNTNKHQQIIHTADDFDDLAKRVATHFRNMNMEQCLLAEKLIFDVCINGRLNRLTTDSSLTLNTKRENCGPSSTFKYED